MRVRFRVRIRVRISVRIRVRVRAPISLRSRVDLDGELRGARQVQPVLTRELLPLERVVRLQGDLLRIARKKVEEALKKGRKVKRKGQVFVEYLNDAKDPEGTPVSYENLAKIIMKPVVAALYLGSDIYKEEVAKARIGVPSTAVPLVVN